MYRYDDAECRVWDTEMISMLVISCTKLISESYSARILWVTSNLDISSIASKACLRHHSQEAAKLASHNLLKWRTP